MLRQIDADRSLPARHAHLIKKALTSAMSQLQAAMAGR
jgi:hypothetical protein